MWYFEIFHFIFKACKTSAALHLNRRLLWFISKALPSHRGQAWHTSHSWHNSKTWDKDTFLKVDITVWIRGEVTFESVPLNRVEAARCHKCLMRCVWKSVWLTSLTVFVKGSASRVSSLHPTLQKILVFWWRRLWSWSSMCRYIKITIW